MKCLILPFLLLLSIVIRAQEIIPPVIKNNFERATSYQEISEFVQQLDQQSDLFKNEVIGKTIQGRNLYALMFSTAEFGKDQSKVKMLIIAQQHGNEQSGKEGALLLADWILKPENKYLLDKIDLAIVPQMNPDGSELNKRRNWNGVDLNRNHLIVTEPEVIAVQKLFSKYLFEVTLDVHEYFPYGSEEWEKYGYRKNTDVTLGTLTNINVSSRIRDLSNKRILPYHLKNVSDAGYTSFEYCPGGPPEIDYIRHSTFDINDGRQSFGIQNTFSFIQEGLNGEDNYIQNLKKRAESQMVGMKGLIEYVYRNSGRIKETVTGERSKLIAGKDSRKVSIQSDHFKNGEKLRIPLYSYFSKKDSVVIVKDYRPVVQSLYDVEKPVGYLIPKNLTSLVAWADRQMLETKPFIPNEKFKVEQYYITRTDSIDFERDIIINPITEKHEFTGKISADDYIYIPTAQIKGNLIVLALEPKSMLGLVTYKEYEELLKVGESFPVLRVVKK